MHSRLRQNAFLQRCNALLSLALLLIALLHTPVNATVSRDAPSWSRDIAEAAADGAQKPFEHGSPAAPTDSATTPPAGGGGEARWPLNPLEELHKALETMQSRYFELWLGQWPSAIDWTAAVMATFVSATLHSLTRSLEYVVLPLPAGAEVEGQRVENEIGRYFSQSVAYYFGEDAFSLRMQAYDDMLWVVLGWLESIKFIDVHTHRHYRHGDHHGPQAAAAAAAQQWYGKQFAPGFAHRAHIFYDIAAGGWDTELCGGGMTWNPRLTPYKNAITNQLWISASIGMYLYFPGDDNTSPFMATAQNGGGNEDGGLPTARPHDRRYLQAAVDGYEWLRGSNMTNERGLYVDGFHITDWGKNGSIGTGRCDERNEMTYTYNQGVLLSGLRGLWEGTGERRYLEDGHELVRNVVKATGWAEHERRRRRGRGGRGNHVHRDEGLDGNSDDDFDADEEQKQKQQEETESSKNKWHGMGRGGVLEEACDASAGCSQNGQTFKGIFFHHLTLFCEPLPLRPRSPGVTHGADAATAALHRQSCKEYAPWVAHNARAALSTRDDEGRFGMWWGAAAAEADDDGVVETPSLPLGAVDYRNDEGVLEGGLWLLPPIGDYDWSGEGGEGGPAASEGRDGGGGGSGLPSFMGFDPVAEATGRGRVAAEKLGGRESGGAEVRDKNDRGRGRTVETQGGGVAVVRALWEFVNMYRE